VVDFPRASFREVGAPPRQLGVLVVVCLVFHGAALLAASQLAKALHLPPAQRVAATVCSSQKTVALGIPLLRALLAPGLAAAGTAGGGRSLALLSAPLLVYHPLQLLVGSCLVPTWRTMVQESSGKQ
jgi:sodium/bile acid cotransporter 7